MATDKPDVKALDSAGLTALLATFGQPAYRARQIERWLYAPDAIARSFDEMTDLPRQLRELLTERCSLSYPELLQRHISRDGTRKYLLRLADGACVECVGIPSGELEGASLSGSDEDGTPKRLTVCFSTQVGCAMGCVFCATGRNGLTRSLTPGEMVDQLSVVASDFAQHEDGGGCASTRITNAVAMGQGEPFANYDATLAALRFINNPKLLGIGARHITVSTCGLLSAIRRFSTEPEQFTLAISLHSAIRTTRNTLLPRLSHQPLVELRLALVNYMEKTGRRPSLEYALIQDINDSDGELDALIAFCKGTGEYASPQSPDSENNALLEPYKQTSRALAQQKAFALGADRASTRRNVTFHVNLIPLNAVDHLDWRPSLPARVQEFMRRLTAAGIETSLRTPRGSDVAGACGQLRNRF